MDLSERIKNEMEFVVSCTQIFFSSLFFEADILTADCLQIPLCGLGKSKNRVDKMLFLWSNKDCKWKFYPINIFSFLSFFKNDRYAERSINPIVHFYGADFQDD